MAALLAYWQVLRVRDALYEMPLSIGALFIAILFGATVTLGTAGTLLLIMFLFSIYSFSSNNFFDKKIDAGNPLKVGRNPYAFGNMSTREILMVNGILLFAMFFIASLSAFTAIPFLALAVINVTAYSRFFKRIAILDLLSHFGWVLSFFVFPFLAIGFTFEKMGLSILAVAAASNLGELDNQRKDAIDDAKAGVRTSAVLLGQSLTLLLVWLSRLCLFVALCLMSWLQHPLFLLALPLVIIHIFQKRWWYGAVFALYLSVSIALGFFFIVLTAF